MIVICSRRRTPNDIIRYFCMKWFNNCWQMKIWILRYNPRWFITMFPSNRGAFFSLFFPFFFFCFFLAFVHSILFSLSDSMILGNRQDCLTCSWPDGFRISFCRFVICLEILWKTVLGANPQFPVTMRQSASLQTCPFKTIAPNPMQINGKFISVRIGNSVTILAVCSVGNSITDLTPKENKRQATTNAASTEGLSTTKR